MIKSQYNIRNDDTNENIEIFGELKGKPIKQRFNSKTTLDCQIIETFSGLMWEGNFSVLYIKEDDYDKIEKSWIYNQKLWIQDLNNKRYLLKIVGDNLDLSPLFNNVKNEIYYTGSINLKGVYYG